MRCYKSSGYLRIFQQQIHFQHFDHRVGRQQEPYGEEQELIKTFIYIYTIYKIYFDSYHSLKN